jgi:UDP-2,3-diacylglucosamine pyrophosphatase LpxH
MKIDKESIYVLGDTHTLEFGYLLKRNNLNNFCLIHLGDAGEIGFYLKRKRELKRLQEYCEKNNGIILIVRGNHSDPDYFNDPNHWTKEFSLVKFVKDYTSFEINDKKFLFVGGATSIDRTENTLYLDYWPNEKFILIDDLSTLSKDYEYLILHSTPQCAPPFTMSNIMYWLDRDKTLYDDLIKERKDIQKLVDHLSEDNKLKFIYNGHFHMSSVYYHSNTKIQTMNCNQLERIL